MTQDHFAWLKERLQGRLDLDVDAAFARFRELTGSTDLDRFLAHLRAQGLVDPHAYAGLAVDPIASLQPTLVEGDGANGGGPAPPPAAPSAERYALLGQLGAGAMGEVLVGRDVALRRKVAYKRMLPTAAERPALVARFFEEVQVTAQLDHPNVIPIYGLEVGADGRMAYAMKLVDGTTLGELFAEAAAAPLNAAGEAARLSRHLNLFLGVCDGIAFAHSRGVLHRDLKPENIMVGRHHEVYVMDWGICRLMNGAGGAPGPGGAAPVPAPADDDGSRTAPGGVVGTPAYMSPEQALGRSDELDGRSDLYALGLILQELVTLRRAVTGGNSIALVTRAAQASREPIVHRAPRLRVPVELRAIIERATARAPADRYPSVAAFAEDIRRFLRGEAVAARPDTALQAILRWMGQHRVLTLVALLLLLLGGAGTTIGVLVRAAAEVARLRQRELAAQSFFSMAAQRTHAIDARFYSYQAELTRVAGATVEALAHSGDDRRSKFYLASDYADPARQPPDVGPGAGAGAQVSFGWPVFKLPPGLDPTAAADDIAALAPLTPALRSMMVASHGQNPEILDEEAARGLLRKRMVIRSTFITLASGLHFSYPGSGGFPADYDGRSRPKYKLAEGRHGVQWGNPYTDRYGSGLLLPSAIALYDHAGHFLGVAGFDMSFDAIIDELLALPGAPYVDDSYLVDGEGRVVIRSRNSRLLLPGQRFGDARDHLADGAAHGSTVQLDDFPLPAVREAMRARRIGPVETGGKVVAVNPLQSLGWFYVVVADGPALFGRRPSEATTAASPRPGDGGG